MSSDFPPIDDSFPRVVPHFRKLVKIMSECVAGGVNLSCAAYEFRECDMALGALLGQFINVLRLKELPKDCLASINEIIVIFSKLSVSMAGLEMALGRDNTSQAIAITNKIFEFLKQLEIVSVDLQKETKDRHMYSDVPVINGILSAGHFVMDNPCEWEALSERLAVIIPEWNEIIAGEGLPEEFSAHDAALDHLATLVNEEDTSQLPQALQEVKETGEELVGFEDSQVKEDTSSILCPLCSKPLTVGSSKCMFCGARMPERFETSVSETTANSVLPTDMPDYIQRLFDSAQALPGNEKMFRPFRRAVGEMRRRAASSQSKVERMAASRVKMTVEERENFEGLIDLANSSLEKYFRAIEMLEAFEPPVDRFHLQCALEAVAGAVDDMRRVGGLARKYSQGK